VLFVTAVLTTACGGGSPGRSSAGAVPGGGAFPVTVQHALGSMVVPAAPQRVLSLGYTDQDAILALGTGGRHAGEACGAGGVGQ
jgi:ABC-type Fe3+-hydroxamate transport system substrate-binding protein